MGEAGGPCGTLAGSGGAGESSWGGAGGRKARLREEGRQRGIPAQVESLLPAARSRRRAQAGPPQPGADAGASAGAWLLSPPDALRAGSCQPQRFPAPLCLIPFSRSSQSPLPPTPSPSSQAGPQLGAARGAATCQGHTAHWLHLALHRQDMSSRSLDLRFMQILHSAQSQSQACPSTKMTGWLFCQEDLPW